MPSLPSLIPFLRIVFCITLFISIFGLVKYFYYKNDRNIHEARGDERSFKKNHRSILDSFKTLIGKNEKVKSFIDKKDAKLRKIGYPLKFNGFLYYVYKFAMILFILLLVLSQIVSKELIIASAMLFILPDLFFKSIKAKEKNKILEDLPYINDVINIQSGAAGMNLGSTLREVFDIANCKRLKDALIELSIEISLTKNVVDALDKFAEKFDIQEIDSFSMALKQAAITGRSKELLDSQSELLKESALSREEARTKQISMYFGIIGMLIFVSTVPLIMFCFISQISNALQGLF